MLLEVDDVSAVVTDDTTVDILKTLFGNILC